MCGEKEAARSLSPQFDDLIPQTGGQLELQHLRRRPTDKVRGDPGFFESSAEINSASAKIFAPQKCLFGADAPPHLEMGPLRKRLYSWAASAS